MLVLVLALPKEAVFRRPSTVFRSRFNRNVGVDELAPLGLSKRFDRGTTRPFRVRFNLVEFQGFSRKCGITQVEFCCRVATTVHACLQLPAFPRDLSSVALAEEDLGVPSPNPAFKPRFRLLSPKSPRFSSPWRRNTNGRLSNAQWTPSISDGHRCWEITFGVWRLAFHAMPPRETVNGFQFSVVGFHFARTLAF
jgi:hypothetical protein